MTPINVSDHHDSFLLMFSSHIHTQSAKYHFLQLLCEVSQSLLVEDLKKTQGCHLNGTHLTDFTLCSVSVQLPGSTQQGNRSLTTCTEVEPYSTIHREICATFYVFLEGLNEKSTHVFNFSSQVFPG